MFAAKKLQGAGGAAAPLIPDPDFNSVSFLSHFDGANNGVNNVFDDGSASNHTITANGSVTQGSFGPFAREAGYWGIDFADNTGSRNGLKLCDGYQTELVMTGTFTIEFWLFHRYSAGYQTFFGSGGGFGGWNSSTGHEIVCFCGPDSAMYFQFWGGSGYISTDATAVVLNEGEWNHVAIVNNGGNWTTYLNGTGNTTTSYGNVASVSSTGTWASYIGCGNGSNDNNPCKGIMSNVRFVKGTAVYTSNFTPSTAPLTAITNTSSLVAQDNRFLDNSSHANTVTATGAIQVTPSSPFAPTEVYNPAVNGASAYFDGSGDYLTVATSSDFDLGTGDFTISAWLYSTNNDSIGILGDMDNSGGTNNYQLFWNQSQSQIRLGTNDLNNMIGWAVTLNLNSWNNIVVSRASGAIKFFFNGTEITSRAADNGDLDGAAFNAPTPVYIGRFNDGNAQLKGYATDVRIIKGTAVNPSGIPTAPVTTITNTKLLLNMANGQAIDSAAQNNFELIGNANVSTDQAKFGNTSFHVPANGDYLKMPGGTETGNFGTGNFTIEMWIYRTASGADQLLIDSRSAGTATDYQTQITSANVLRSRYGGIANTSATVPVNEWVHIAIVRNSGTVTQYINGTGGGTYSSSASLTVTSSGLTLGGSANSSGSIAGYIDDIRISKMARYTSNFTPPDAPFPDIGE